MAISTVKIECPACGANLLAENDRQVMYCPYCGAKILLVNENEYVYRRVDEAELKRVEYEHSMQLRQIELEKEFYNQKKAEKKAQRKRGLIITIISSIMMVLFFYASEKTGNLGFPLLVAFSLMFAFVGLGTFTDGITESDEMKKKKK